jgi:hypothetical protein
VRQLRAELAATAFPPSDGSHINPIYGTKVNGDADPSANGNGTDNGNEAAVDGRTASLHILRTMLHGINAPNPPPHADDLLHMEIYRKVCAVLPLFETFILAPVHSDSLHRFHLLVVSSHIPFRIRVYPCFRPVILRVSSSPLPSG